MKKLSIGLTLIGMSVEEYISIIDKYKENLSTIYYSPCNEKFFSRKYEGRNFKSLEELEIDELKVLEYARSKGIKLELAINTKKNTNEEVRKVILREKRRIVPDEIVTISKHIDVVREVFPDQEYTLSYNEGLFTLKQLEELRGKFHYVVIGNRWIRDIHFMNAVYDMGFKIKHMVNNGCSHNCTYCYSATPCEDVMLFNISKYTIDVTYAMNTIYPFEIHECLDNFNAIDSFKISNRPCSYRDLNMLLDSYVNNINDYSIGSDEEKRFFDVMSRISYYKKFLKFINKEKVYEIKNKELEKMRRRINECND